MEFRVLPSLSPLPLADHMAPTSVLVLLNAVHPPHLALAITSYKGWAAAGTCARSDMVSKVSMVSTRQENILAIE